MKPKTALIHIDEKGRTQLPDWVRRVLLKKAGCKSKNSRVQKKVVKREFIKLIKEYIDAKKTVSK